MHSESVIGPDGQQKSNYDRWKPSTKLACMIELYGVSKNPEYFDQSRQRFSPLAWHLVADALNKEYPNVAKRFTNINIKCRYQRVLKYHKVFKRMALASSGFKWNSRAFCFEETAAIEDQLSRNNLNDEILNSEINLVKLLTKAGHADIEYFHRFIYVDSKNSDRDDQVLQSKSYINFAIEYGVLTQSSSRPEFFKDLQNATSNPTSFLAPSVSHVPPTYSENYDQHKPTLPLSTMAIGVGASIVTNDGSGFLNQLPQLDMNQVGAAQFHYPQTQASHIEVPSSVLSYPYTPVPSRHGSDTSHVNSVTMPSLTDNIDQFGFSEYTNDIICSIPQVTLSRDGDLRKKRKLDNDIQNESGSQALTPEEFPFIEQHFDTSLLPLNAVLTIHKEFEHMKEAVSNKVYDLRMSQTISYEDFTKLQQLLETSTSFLRSANKRLSNDESFLELIKVYTDKS